MTDDKKKKDQEKKSEGTDIDFGLGGLFKGLTNLIDTATKLAEKGEELSRTGEIKFSGLEKIKGLRPERCLWGKGPHYG